MFAKRAVGLILSAVFTALLLLPLSLAADAEDFEEGCSCCFPLYDNECVDERDYFSETIPDDYKLDSWLYGEASDFAFYEAGDSPSLFLLKQRYPHGKYWNYGNLDGYSDIPCEKHRGTVSSSCNDFKKSTQCLGFARKLGWDAYGSDPKFDWQTTSSYSYIPYLKPGDIIRYRSNGHSIFVTDVFDSYILVGECNWDNCCGISWGRKVNKSDLDITTIFIAPYALPGGTIMNDPAPPPPDCGCIDDYSGVYTTKGVTDNLRIRSGHGTEYSTIGRIPANAIFNVTKGNGSWAHVTYNGISGYASMEYIQRIECYIHDWVLIEEQPGSCASDGFKKYKCLFCGEEKFEDIPALGHSFEGTRFASIYPYNEYQPCSNCGERYYTGENCIEVLDAIFSHMTGQKTLPGESFEKYDRLVKDGVLDIRDYNAFFAKIDKE